MAKEKAKHDGLLCFLLALIVVLILIIAICASIMYMQKMEADKEITELENKASELQEAINDLQGKTENISNTMNSNNKENISHINEKTFMIISVENKNANEPASKYKMVTDKKAIGDLIDIINSASKYEAKSFIPDLGDTPPTVEVYEDNGEKYTIFAGDKIDDNGNIVNLMVKYNKHDGSDKELYKLDIKLEEYIENLYNTSKLSTVEDNKEIYKRVSISDMEDSAWEVYNEIFIVVEENTMYFSTDLSDKILEGTYKLNSNNDIEYKLLQPTQDYAFYTASTFKFETINGEKNIVIDNSPNGMMHYQKVH